MAGQGQSLATIDKERRIGAALSIGMQIASRAGKRKFAGKGYRYWHFDANCGSGWNQKVNVPGSPLVFWHVAKTCLFGLEAAPFFCDIDQAAMRELQDRLSPNPDAAARSALLPYDNQEAIEVFAERIRQSENPLYAIGSVLIDPNGYYYRRPDGIGAPVEALTWFCREFPRIDLILNLNTRTYQMQAPHGHAVLPPRELLRSLGKAHWLVGQAHPGHDRFMLAIGRNVATHDHRKLRLFNLESEEGHAIITAAEGKRQQPLPDLSRVPAASGVSGRARHSDAPHQGALPEMRRAGERGASPAISAVGNVRHPVKPHAAVSSLPLFGAR